ncbi:hypothetical protein IFM89_024855 [Coptis chinensis]|uniref:NAD-dependent epimerase/dehydratase domain-containing protein n=1 Tax=Coptis chinensis TaxID=261450 RepID=A0A835HQ01_9MAGN|nr:hypothetical protein IFM89_024855 [Coptis chinensis]
MDRNSSNFRMEIEKNTKVKVCVTGGAGFIASWLVMKLLAKGYIVHATLRNLDDLSKVGLLKGLPNAEERLKLFKADIYEPDSFQSAIEGCEYVFHAATPMQHNSESTVFKDTTEAAIAGVKSILGSCIKSGTIKRLVYTASVVSVSPMKEDGTGYNGFIDEFCWTPVDHSIVYGDKFFSDYTTSKTLAEKEVLRFNDKEKFGLDVVTLACGLVVGDTVLPHLGQSQEAILSPVLNNTAHFNHLKLLQEMLGSIPLLHIDDVCDAHIFCIEKPLMNGRFICANDYPTLGQVTDYYRQNYPDLTVTTEGVREEQDMRVRGGSTKLTDLGFQYKYDIQKMLDDNVKCARKLGALH